MSWIKKRLNNIQQNSCNPKKQQQFGFMLCMIFLLFLGFSFYKDGLIFNTKQVLFISILFILLLSTLFFKKGLFPILYCWFFFGEILGSITSFVVMAIIYFLIFSPITFILNIFNKKSRYTAKWISKEESIDYENLG